MDLLTEALSLFPTTSRKPLVNQSLGLAPVYDSIKSDPRLDSESLLRIAELDTALSTYIITHPSQVETELANPNTLAALALNSDRHFRSRLQILILHIDEALPLSWQSLRPDLMALALVSAVCALPSDQFLSPPSLLTRSPILPPLRDMCRRAGRDAVEAVLAGLPKEVLDSVLEDVFGANPSRLSLQTLREYCGCDYLPRLYPGGSSQSGFLAFGESLVQQVEADSVVLAALNVSAGRIAQRMRALFASTRIREHSHTPEDEAILVQSFGVSLEDALVYINQTFDVHITPFLAPQLDPFYTTFAVHPRDASMDMWIRNKTIAHKEGAFVAETWSDPPAGWAPSQSICVGGILPRLIERLSFFLGGSPYRLDPRHAVKVLQLV